MSEECKTGKTLQITVIKIWLYKCQRNTEHFIIKRFVISTETSA